MAKAGAESDILAAYGGEINVSRGLDFFSSEILRLSKINLNTYLRSAQSLLVIGVGRGAMLFDIVQRYPNITEIFALSREDLLVDNPNSLEHLAHTSRPESEWSKLTQLDYNQIVARMQQANHIGDVSSTALETQAYDVALFGPSVSEYVPDKAAVIAKIKRSLRKNGIGFCDLVQFRLKPKATTPKFLDNHGHSHEYEFFPEPNFPDSGLLVIRNVNPLISEVPLQRVEIKVGGKGPGRTYLETYQLDQNSA